MSDQEIACCGLIDLDAILLAAPDARKNPEKIRSFFYKKDGFFLK